MAEDELVVLADAGTFPRVELAEPSTAGFVLLAFEVDRRPGLLYFWQSRRKKRMLARLNALAHGLELRDTVEQARVFRALMVPPGRGRSEKSNTAVPDARFDVVLLIALTDVTAAERLRADPAFNTEISALAGTSRRHMVVVAENVRSIAPVDHTRNGVFLFNFFVAASREQVLAVWELTAGWFQDRTGLDNSTLMLPRDTELPYALINHCRWDGLDDVLPALLFDQSFNSYVLAHFAANRIAAMPVLYRLA